MPKQQLRDTALNIAIAKALGWVCWESRDGIQHVILNQSSREWMTKVPGSATEVTGAWPADAMLSLAPSQDWAHSLDAAFQLGEPDWHWATSEYEEYLYMRVWKSAAEHFAEPDARIKVVLAEFPSKLEVHAAARCWVFLRMMARLETSTNE